MNELAGRVAARLFVNRKKFADIVRNKRNHNNTNNNVIEKYPNSNRYLKWMVSWCQRIVVCCTRARPCCDCSCKDGSPTAVWRRDDVVWCPRLENAPLRASLISCRSSTPCTRPLRTMTAWRCWPWPIASACRVSCRCANCKHACVHRSTCVTHIFSSIDIFQNTLTLPRADAFNAPTSPLCSSYNIANTIRHNSSRTFSYISYRPTTGQ